LAQLSAQTNYAAGAIYLSAFSLKLFYALLQLRRLLSSNLLIPNSRVVGARSRHRYWRSIVTNPRRWWRTAADSQNGRRNGRRVDNTAIVKSLGRMPCAAALPEMMFRPRSMDEAAGLFSLAGTRMRLFVRFLSFCAPLGCRFAKL
jgi:hypothetical protein